MNEELARFKEYLVRNNFAKRSIDGYLYQVTNFLTVYSDAEFFGYKDMMNVLEETAKQHSSSRYRISILSAIKKYYDYLLDAGRRDDHPCKRIFIKHNQDKSVIHSDLFSSAELELLMDRKERYPRLQLKNQALISMLIYQGLSSSEIQEIKVQHINLDEGRIYVKESRDLARRHLDMHPKQYRIFDRYIHESRKSLLKVETDKLIIGVRGTPISGGEVGFLVEQFKPLFPGRVLNPKTIRLSVIANWLNEKKFPLEMVQLMAGHRWISTTLKYKQTDTDEKRALINRFHPLG